MPKNRTLSRSVAVDKYIDVSNKKLQAAQFRRNIVRALMDDKNMSVDEANDEFDKMMNAMNRDESGTTHVSPM